MTQRNELLPCPFCGNSKNIAMTNEKHDHSGGYFIACPVCNASTTLVYACGDDPRPILAEKWNRRAHLASQPEAAQEGWRLVPVDVVQAAANKLALIGKIYDGDKESRRLAKTLAECASAPQPKGGERE